MSDMNFNAITTLKELKAAGFSEPQAEAAAMELLKLNNILLSIMLTKEEFKQELRVSNLSIESKIGDLGHKIDKLKYQLLTQLGTLMIILFGVAPKIVEWIMR